MDRDQKSLIIISSPFQAICAIEAINNFNIKDFEIIILYGRTKAENETCKVVLDTYNYKYTELTFPSYLYGIKYLYSNKGKGTNYSTIILGDFFNLDQRLLAAHFISDRSQLIYVDDGASSFRIFDQLTVENKIKWKTKQFIPNFILNIKHCKRKTLFSIFDLTLKKGWNTYPNNLTFLKSQRNSQKVSGIYIVGTNTSIIEPILRNPFTSYLEKTVSYLRNSYPNKKIYYYPHRRDKNNKVINAFLEKEDVHIINTEFTIEIDLILKGADPQVVIGFGSTALYTLKKIFEKSNMISISLETTSEMMNESFNRISEKYKNEGIEILNF